MTDTNPDPNASLEALQSPVEPPAPEVAADPVQASEPTPEPAEVVSEASEPEVVKPEADAPDLDFDPVEVNDEFVGKDHPSKQPVASRPAPAGPYSNPPERIARARNENL